MSVRRPPVLAVALALALTTVLAVCGGDDGPTDPNEDRVVEIDLTNFQFSDDDVTISPGTTVRWINQSANTVHTVTPDGHGEWTEWVTDAMGETFEHTFDTVGDYPYICVPHESLGMVGIIRVQ